MELIIKIVSFLTRNPFGLILLSILSGIIGNWLFSLLKVVYRKLIKHYRHRRFVNRLVKMATAHIYGQRAAKIALGTPAQAAIWAADFVMNYVKHVAIILGLLLLLGIILIVLPAYMYWLPVTIISIIISIRYKLMKRLLNFFEMTEDLVFGKKYLESEKEGYTKYWDSLFKPIEPTAAKTEEQQQK